MIANTRGRPGDTALYSFTRESEQSPDDQLSDLQDVAYEQGAGLEWYCDWHGTPDVRRRAQGLPADMGRPAYCTFLRDLRAGRVCWLVVWRLDKLGLNQGGLAELFAELARHHAGFTSLQDNLCIEPDALGELPAVLEAAVFCERRLLGQRTAEGCAAAKAAGKKLGGSRKGRILTVTEELRAQVHALAAEGRPKAYIARVLGLDRSTVYRLLGKGRRRKRPEGKTDAPTP